MIDYKAIRTENLERLNRDGFVVAPSLPIGPRGESSKLRPTEEIAKRLWGLKALFCFLSWSNGDFSKREIRNYIESNSLSEHLTPDENSMLIGWRWLQRRRHGDFVGWYLENMLPLAWVLGFDIAPSLDGEMLQGPPLKRLIAFVGDANEEFDAWGGSQSLRAEDTVIAMEDLFYCAHNAVRSAQVGRGTVPEGFHPVTNGGVIHERRHALTWLISAGTDWDNVDLST